MTASAAALALAAEGLSCFPVLPSKAPACPTGFKAASRDAATLGDLWRRHPGPLIGVPTGEANGFDVLDIDPRSGGDAWHAQHRHRLPQTRTHATRSGGLHLLFLHHPGLRNTAGKIAPGIDVRADGGFIVWWAAAGLPLAVDAPLAPWPAWLLATLLPPPTPRLRAAPPLPCGGDAARRYAIAALRNAVQRVATAADGTRNDRLNAECFSLTRFFATGALAPQEVADALAVAACHAGLSALEIARTLASALRAGGGA